MLHPGSTLTCPNRTATPTPPAPGGHAAPAPFGAPPSEMTTRKPARIVRCDEKVAQPDGTITLCGVTTGSPRIPRCQAHRYARRLKTKRESARRARLAAVPPTTDEDPNRTTDRVGYVLVPQDEFDAAERLLVGLLGSLDRLAENPPRTGDHIDLTSLRLAKGIAAARDRLGKVFPEVSSG